MTSIAGADDTLDIDATDVVKIILQWAKESGLEQTHAALSAETNTSLNAVEDVDAFKRDIVSGRWDVVLPQLAKLRLPKNVLEDAYEHVTLEMCELGEHDTARAILRQSSVMAIMKAEQSRRYGRLEHYVSAKNVTGEEAYGGTSKEKRREKLAETLAREVIVVPPSRLLALIGQALKWQKSTGALPPGTAFDLFRGQAPVDEEEEEQCPTVSHKRIKFSKKSFPECAKFSPCGGMLATGSADGFIEIWDPYSGKLRKDLKYQAEDMMMMHDDAVLAIAFSQDSDMLASGSQDGKVKVWRVSTGTCLRKFEKAHQGGVTSVSFSKDGSQVLSASFDGLVRVHGLKSGKLLKEFRGHSSYVNSVAFTDDESNIVSASSDGSVKVWDAKTAECKYTFKPPPPVNPNKDNDEETYQTGTIPAVISAIPHPKNDAQIIVTSKSNAVFVCTLAGEVVETYWTNKIALPHTIVSSVPSPRGEWIYAISEACELYCFSTVTKKLESTVFNLHESSTLGVAHHPRRNLLATLSSIGELKTWKP
jgi:WD40 repeat-containing protein SMU1